MTQIQNPVDDALQEIAEQYQATYPRRTVTRVWQDRAAYKNEQLSPGIVTIVFTSKVLGADPHNAYFNFLVVGRIYCGKDAIGLAVEQAELAMSAELEILINSHAVVHTTINRINTSNQMEGPDGFFIAECTAGPLDLSPYIEEEPATNVDTILLGVSPNTGQAHLDSYEAINLGENNG